MADEPDSTTIVEELAGAVNGRPEPAPLEEWQVARNGKQYVPKGPAQRGVIYRQGDETIAQARDRNAAATAGDRRPKRKSKAPKMPPAPRQIDLKEIEATLADALKSPALICATFGDEWASDHFTTTGPYLARNLIMASEHNPWLRKKLEDAAQGQDAMVKVMAMVSVGGAVFMYAVPPIIWWFNLPAPKKTRELFGIPERRQHEREPEYAADQVPEAPETANPFAVA